MLRDPEEAILPNVYLVLSEKGVFGNLLEEAAESDALGGELAWLAASIRGTLTALTGLASSGIYLVMILQELEEIARVYGQAFRTILSQTDVKLFFGASGETARILAAYLGEEEIITESYSLGQHGRYHAGSFARSRAPGGRC